MTDELKKLYREVAKRVHPDLANDLCARASAWSSCGAFLALAFQGLDEVKPDIVVLLHAKSGVLGHALTKGEVCGLEWSNDTRYLLTYGESIELWDTRFKFIYPLAVFPRVSGFGDSSRESTSLRFHAAAMASRSLALIAAVQVNGTDNELWSLEIPSLSVLSRMHTPETIFDLSWIPGREQIVAACADRTILAVDPVTLQQTPLPFRAERCTMNQVNDLCAFQDGTKLIIGDLQNGNVVSDYSIEEDDEIDAMCWSQNGGRFYAIGLNGILYTYNQSDS